MLQIALFFHHKCVFFIIDSSHYSVYKSIKIQLPKWIVDERVYFFTFCFFKYAIRKYIIFCKVFVKYSVKYCITNNVWITLQKCKKRYNLHN